MQPINVAHKMTLPPPGMLREDKSIKLPPIKHNQTATNMSDAIKPRSLVNMPQSMNKTNE